MLARLEKAMRMAPPPIKRAAKRGAGPVDRLLIAEYRRRTAYDGPVPPAVLRARVGGGVRPETFFDIGRDAANTLEAALGESGRSFATSRFIYDWGCGCGRLLAHLDALRGPDTRLGGSDVDDQAVAWASRTWPHMELHVNAFSPPVPLADGEVDCLISSSIFTHLSEPDQDAWLGEIRRVLAPDGVALITVAGEAMYQRTRSGELASRGHGLMARLAAMPPALEPQGFLFVPYTRGRYEDADFRGVTGDYGLAFHAPRYLEEHWSRWLRVVDHHPAALNVAQDLVVVSPR